MFIELKRLNRAINKTYSLFVLKLPLNTNQPVLYFQSHLNYVGMFITAC